MYSHLFVWLKRVEHAASASVSENAYKESQLEHKGRAMQVMSSNVKGEFMQHHSGFASLVHELAHKSIWEQVVGICTIVLSITTFCGLLSLFLWF